MNAKQERQYKRLVEFLGKVLYPDYEITLHNLSNKRSSLVAIANGHVSGREPGAPSTGFVKKMLAERQYETNDFLISYRSRTVNNKTLRSSSYFIKNEANKPVGMLCINFDDSRYRELSERLLDICHPQAFIANGETCADGEKRLGGERRLDGEKSLDGERRLGSEPVTAKEDDVLYEPVETFYGDAETEFDATVAGVINGPKKDRMSRADRLEIIARLDKNGFFLIKGTIPLAAERLGCSPASVYRYLKEVGNRSRTQ